MKIYKQNDVLPKATPNKSGNGIEPVYEYVLNKETGLEEYKKVGETNLDAKIQAARKTCDMDYIIKNLINGNTAVLNARNGVYIDTTTLPTNIQEAKEMSLKLGALYNDNPMLSEIYPTFDDYEKALLNNDDVIGKLKSLYDEKIKALNKPNEDVKKEEVK